MGCLLGCVEAATHFGKSEDAVESSAKELVSA